MGIEGVVLEDHRDVAILRIDVRHVSAADQDRAVTDLLQPGDAAQKRRLPAAGGTHEHDELAVLDRQVDAVDSANAVRKRLDDGL